MQFYELKYINHTDKCYINGYGEVYYRNELLENYIVNGALFVDIFPIDNKYIKSNIVNQYAPIETRRQLIWLLMKDTWFFHWPEEGIVSFLDGDFTNCSVENIRARDPKTGEIYGGVLENWGYRFDKRYKARVEIVETGEQFDSVSAAARHVGGSKTGVSLMLSGKLKTHKGLTYRWIS